MAAVDPISQYFASGATRVPTEGQRAGAGTPVTPHRDATVPPQGFRVHYQEPEVVIDYRDDAGLAAGLDVVATLNDDTSFDSALEVRDAPILATRAFLLDVSADRIIAWDGMVRLVTILRQLRYNQLEIRVGHAFTYRDQEPVWRGSTPLTPTQLHRLEELCNAHGIRLVLSIEPLTHWERWLSHPEHAWRAELPAGHTTPDGRHVPPSELAPTAENVEFVADLVDQLSGALAVRRINVGGHSTRELGHGASRQIVRERGQANVYLDFLTKMLVTLSARDIVSEMWSDIFRVNPDLLNRIPGKVLPIVRCSEPPVGEAGQAGRGVPRLANACGSPILGGFAQAGAALADSDRAFWVGPGTSTWNTFCGRMSQMRANIADAVQWGVPAGASGMLLTAWGGQGHWAPDLLLLPALVEAGISGWRGKGSGDDLQRLVEALVPEDVVVAMFRLADLTQVLPVPLRNTDITWEALRRGGHVPESWNITEDKVRAGWVVLAETRNAMKASIGSQGRVMRFEMKLCADFCEMALILLDVAAGRRTDSHEQLQERWEQLCGRQRKEWRVSAREGGLKHSLNLLDPVAALKAGPQDEDGD